MINFWNAFPVEKFGGNILKSGDDIFIISTNLQKVFTDTSDKALKMFNDLDRVIYKNITKNLNFVDYKPIPGETKSSRYK